MTVLIVGAPGYVNRFTAVWIADGEYNMSIVRDDRGNYLIVPSDCIQHIL